MTQTPAPMLQTDALPSTRRRTRAARLALALGMLISLLVAGSRTAAADGDEAPATVIAIANAPGMVTLYWNHTGEGVYGFVVEQEVPFAARILDADKRIWSVVGLEAGRTYHYRVCAVFDYNRVCSDWKPVTTPLPPPPPPSSSGSSGGSSSGARLPAAVATPKLRATVVNAAQVNLDWDLPPSGSVALTHGTLYRDGTAIYEALQEGNFDADYTDVNRRQNTTYRYTFCFAGPAFGERCSAEVTVTTPLVVATPYTPGDGTAVSAFAPELEVHHFDGPREVAGAGTGVFTVGIRNTGRTGTDVFNLMIVFGGTHLLLYDIVETPAGWACRQETKRVICTGALGAPAESTASATVKLKLWGAAPGRATLLAIVDSSGSVAELNEQNNQKTLAVTVK